MISTGLKVEVINIISLIKAI